MLDTQTPSKTCPGVKNHQAHNLHEPHVMQPDLMHEPQATLRAQTEPIEVPSPQRRPTMRKPRRPPTPPLCDAGPAEMMKILTLDGEWRTMGRSPLSAANELLDGDDDDCPVCGSLRPFRPADDDEGPFAMSPPKLSPRVCRCPPVRPGG